MPGIHWHLAPASGMDRCMTEVSVQGNTGSADLNLTVIKSDLMEKRRALSVELDQAQAVITKIKSEIGAVDTVLRLFGAGEPLHKSVLPLYRRNTSQIVLTVLRESPRPLTALELARIVQEALVNVRKHSRARNVLVRLTNNDHTCTLVIEDDGQGFDFEGRLSARELEKRRVGPAIIKERARIAGAQLAVDSAPGVGARLELTFDESVHA